MSMENITRKRPSERFPKSDTVTFEEFTASQAESVYDDKSKSMWLVKRQDPDGVQYHMLDGEAKAKFLAARQKEVETLIAKGALKKLTVLEAKAFEDKYGSEFILDSGFVDKWKTTDDDVIAKSRHCIKGWQDPMILQIERTAPAPTAEDEAACFQVVASEHLSLIHISEPTSPY